MAVKAKKQSTKDVEIKYSGTIEFEGSVSEFRAVMTDLAKLSKGSVKIGTWPTPEHPTTGMRIETFPLPEVVAHFPWPRPFPGIIDIPRYIDRDILEKIIEGMPRFPIIDDICGGIRTAHLHLHGEIILLDKDGFKDIVKQVAAELAGNLTEIVEFPQTVGAIRHLIP